MPPERNPRPEAIRSGHGIVRLRGNEAYEGNYVIDGSWVTLTGRRRNPQASGDVLYGSKDTWTWPARRVEVIIDREPETVAA
ncbi:MAG: hypothetical protein WBV77_15020 [Solirubrobacteraceae bacterium]